MKKKQKIEDILCEVFFFWFFCCSYSRYFPLIPLDQNADALQFKGITQQKIQVELSLPGMLLNTTKLGQIYYNSLQKKMVYRPLKNMSGRDNFYSSVRRRILRSIKWKSVSRLLPPMTIPKWSPRLYASTKTLTPC